MAVIVGSNPIRPIFLCDIMVFLKLVFLVLKIFVIMLVWNLAGPIVLGLPQIDMVMATFVYLVFWVTKRLAKWLIK